MKKIFLGTFAAVALLFASCSSDTTEGVDIPQGEGVRIEMTLDGASAATKAAGTATKPKTSWANIGDVRFFFVNDATGAVTKVIESQKAIPTGANTLTENVLSITAGDYHVVAVANAKVSAKLATFARNVATPWSSAVVGEKFGNATTNLYFDAIGTTLPTAIGTSSWTAADKGYSPLSEVFVAVGKIKIEKDQAKTLPLTLKREVSMLRVRVDKTINFLNEAGKLVEFNKAGSSFMIHRVPKGLSFSPKVEAGDKGIYGELVGGVADKDKIFVVSRDANTFKVGAANAADYDNPTAVVDAKFTHWQDAIVFPNMPLASARAYADADVPSDQKYFIQFSAWAPAGYVAEDGVVPAGGALIYWQGSVNKGLIANMIREVNVTITTPGKINPPTDPSETGNLDIVVSSPIAWDNAVNENINI